MHKQSLAASAKISVVINTINEAKSLSQTIVSVRDFADEILVCDMESTDGSVEVARKLGAKVITHKKVDYVELVRNYAISMAEGDWILILDPDEEVAGALSRKLKEIIKKPSADYFRIPRKNLIFGKWMKHSRWWPDYNIRFFKKGSVSWSEIIHAVPMTTGKGAEIPDREELSIIHHHYDSIEQYVERLNRYTSVQADLKIKEGYKFNYLDLIRKPANEFLSRFFFGEAYKDGLHGFAVSLLQAFSEIVLYLKLWQKSGFKEEKIEIVNIKNEVRKVRRDFNHWFADASFTETGNVMELIKRKFKIF